MEELFSFQLVDIWQYIPDELLLARETRSINSLLWHDDCYSSVTPFSSAVTISIYVVCSLESTGHQFLAIPEQVSELASTFGLDKTWSTINFLCKTQMHWKPSEHRARVPTDQNEARPIPWPSFPIGRSMEHLFLLAQAHDCGLIGSPFPLELCHIRNLVCNLHGYCIRILSVELLCLWSLKQDTDNSCFSKHLFHEGKHWFLELCSCSITSAPVLQHSWLATMAALLCQRMQKMGAGNTGHSSSIGLHLIQFEQLLSFATARSMAT